MLDNKINRKGEGLEIMPVKRWKFNSVFQKKYLELLDEGHTDSSACKSLGVDRTTVWKYRKSHPEFEEMVVSARAVRVERVKETVYQKALGGDIRAAKLFLRHHEPEIYEQKTNVNIEQKSVTKIDLRKAIQEMSDEEFFELIGEVQETS